MWGSEYFSNGTDKYFCSMKCYNTNCPKHLANADYEARFEVINLRGSEDCHGYIMGKKKSNG